MTVQQTSFLKNNIFNLSTLFAVLGFIIYQARWQEKVDVHINDKSMHQEFKEQVQIFVPRIELDSKFKSISDQLDRIEKKLDK